MKPRPKLFLHPVLLGLAAIASGAVLARGGVTFVAAWVVAAVATWLLGTWLLFPYSAWARRLRLPPPEVFEKHRDASAFRKNSPIIGPLYRRLSRLTAPTATKIETDYQEWVKGERRRLGMDEP